MTYSRVSLGVPLGVSVAVTSPQVSLLVALVSDSLVQANPLRSSGPPRGEAPASPLRLPPPVGGGVGGGSRKRAGIAYINALADSFSDRDWAILETVEKLGLATGDQIERLHFFKLSRQSAAISRRRVLRRLTDAHAVWVLPRRIGGDRRGSAQQVYALDTAGIRLLSLRRNLSGAQRVWRRSTPGVRFTAHVLAVAELHTRVTVACRGHNVTVSRWDGEPACWWPDTRRPLLKPDAYLALTSPTYADHWWLEVDLATESVPTVRKQLHTYSRFASAGHEGPADVMPRVLLTVPTPERREAVTGALTALPDISQELVTVVLYRDATDFLISTALHPTDPESPTGKETTKQ